MPTFSDIMAARKSLEGYVYETPLLNSNALRSKTHHQRVLLKCENLQRTGSYHLRGMMYKMIRTKEEDLGINNFITHSTANAGPALSCAAQCFQSTGQVIVPEGTLETITRSITHYGGHFYTCQPTLESRMALTDTLMKKFNEKNNQAIFVHPYDDEDIITGYGTCGVELMLQADCSIDCVVAPVGGGALVSGIALAVKGMRPHVAVFAAEPSVVDDAYQSFKKGELVVSHRVKPGENPYLTKSLARGLQSPLTPRTFKYLQHNLDGVIRVSEEEIRYAFRYVYERCKLVIDTNAAVAVAAVLQCPEELRQFRNVAIILSGGNVDLNEVPQIAVAKL